MSSPPLRPRHDFLRRSLELENVESCVFSTAYGKSIRIRFEGSFDQLNLFSLLRASSSLVCRLAPLSMTQIIYHDTRPRYQRSHATINLFRSHYLRIDDSHLSCELLADCDSTLILWSFMNRALQSFYEPLGPNNHHLLCQGDARFSRSYRGTFLCQYRPCIELWHHALNRDSRFCIACENAVFDG